MEFTTVTSIALPVLSVLIILTQWAPNRQLKTEGSTSNSRPWWCRGGMHIHEVGSVLTITGPFFVLAKPALSMPVVAFAMAASFALMVAVGLHATKSFFVAFILPLYHVSIFLVFLTPASTASIPFLALLAFAFAVMKVGVCMSVCLHRYAAHAAFKCGPATNIFLGFVGTLANQGGPIWWASQHRCHHKFCDEPKDPHSSKQSGVFRAFAFFDEHKGVLEEFAPLHCDTLAMRVIDTFAFVGTLIELIVSHHFFGSQGLWVTYTASWLSQTTSLWFNIANHPPPEIRVAGEVTNAGSTKSCLAADAPVAKSPNPLFHLIAALSPYVSGVVAEGGHAHHHDHSNLSLRPGVDFPFHFFIRPMRAAGLAWDVHCHGDNKKHI